MGNKRVNIKAILADPDLRRKLMVPTIKTTQAREGIDTTLEQADRAYYVVSEGERATFFELERFKGGKRGEPDRRHEMFVKAIRAEVIGVRHDVPRRDFSAIDGSPLAYERVAIVAPIFREAPALDPAHAFVVQGLATAADERFVRCWWEIPATSIGKEKVWIPFAKGGEFSRFYSDIYLVVQWTPYAIAIMKDSGRVQNVDYYFKPGFTWPLAGSNFGVRLLPPDCIFGHKGPAIIQRSADTSLFLAGVTNSVPAEYLLRTLLSRKDMGGRWEVGVVKRLPIPRASTKQTEHVSYLAKSMYESKRDWDSGNEISTYFDRSWLLRAAKEASFAATLTAILKAEADEEVRIQELYSDLNDEAFRLYGIPEKTRAQIEQTFHDRPPEILWPQMEGKTAEQKRMEHVWRLLSYAVKRVLEADDDGIISFGAVNGEARLVDRVREELARFFPGRDANRIEVEIVNELKQTVKGYRKCASLDEWLDNVYFEYHCGLYKRRPIFWQIASAQGTASFAFGALVHYHRFDKNRIAMLRSTYLRDAIEEFRREAGLADKDGRTDDRLEWQAKAEEAQALDRKLQLIQEGHHEGVEGGDSDYRILTPWKKQEERPKGWDPDLDDGVKVNIGPFEKAGVLRVGKVT
jgi:hypothetical protein